MLYRALLIIVLMSSALFAFTLESSPSANATSGLTIISQSVLDGALSPLLSVNGWGVSYQRLYNLNSLPAYELAASLPVKSVQFSAGSGYLAHTDYRDIRPWLNLGYITGDFGLGVGVSGHFDSIQGSDSRQKYALNLAAQKQLFGGAVEWKSTDIGTSDLSHSLSLKSPQQEFGVLAAGCEYLQEELIFKTAIHAEIFRALSVAASWQNRPSRFGIGLFLKADAWKLAYSIRSHPYLNYSHAISLESCW